MEPLFTIAINEAQRAKIVKALLALNEVYGEEFDNAAMLASMLNDLVLGDVVNCLTL